jgi:hypothetical protein
MEPFMACPRAPHPLVIRPLVRLLQSAAAHLTRKMLTV